MSSYNNVATLTKKYIIDLLNLLFFSNTITWEDEDQFNYLPSLQRNEEDFLDQRAALLVHKKYPWAVRLIISVIHEESTTKVCYRIKSIDKEIYIDDLNRTVLPFDVLNLDFSICDLNLAVKDNSSLIFHDFLGKSSSRAINLLKFLLDSDLVILREFEVFSSLLLDDGNLPPISSDLHFNPIFEVN